MSTGKSYEVEESGFFLGQRKDCLSKKIPLFDTLGKVVGLLGISFDITKKKRIEELESKLKIDEVLSKVVQEVAHDIASPVSSLKIIEEVYDGKLSEQDGRMLKSAILSIEGMTGKILSNYRISKNLEIEKKTAVDKVEEKNMCPYVILPDIVENMRYRNRQANIEIKYESDNGNNFEFIKGDDADFGRMMVNLIKNAQEAIAEERKGIIEIFLSKKENNIEIRVKDNGKGISKEMAQKLEKGEGIGTTKEEKGGHGIGTQQIINTIKAMNGKIKIETKEKEGTEFILTFPKIQKS